MRVSADRSHEWHVRTCTNCGQACFYLYSLTPQNQTAFLTFFISLSFPTFCSQRQHKLEGSVVGCVRVLPPHHHDLWADLLPEKILRSAKSHLTNTIIDYVVQHLLLPILQHGHCVHARSMHISVFKIITAITYFIFDIVYQ